MIISPRRDSPPFPHVRSVPREGLEPSRGKPSQDFKSATGKLQLTEITIFINQLGISYLGWSGVE